MTDEAAPALAVSGIAKAFPGVQALRNVSFDSRTGEIHALVGENGAGKSTLMRILSGVYKPDAGEIRIGGHLAVNLSPGEARRLGVAMVYQDTRLVPDLDAIQNIHLGREPGGFWVDRPRMRKEAEAILARLGEDLDLRRPVRGLSLAERQIIEIARALAVDARVLILDEPTSALSPSEADRLFQILRELRASGTAVIFISHRLPEVLAIADRITVMKDGEIVGTVATSSTNEDAIVAMMVGRELGHAFPPRADRVGEPVVVAEHLTAPGRFEDVSFTVHAGEIVGFGGITGSGQQAIVRSLYGLVPHEGTISIGGSSEAIGSPSEAIAAGIVYLPSDRRQEGMFGPHSVSENIALPHVADWSHLGVVDTARERTEVAHQIESLDVKTPSARQPVGLLSGGNQQKVAFARWLLSSPKVCIFDEPTQGVDVGVKLEIYGIIRDLAQRGIAVIVVSSDVIELIGLSDRVLIVAKGRIVDEVAGTEATEERIIGSAVGLRSRNAQASSSAVAGGTARQQGRETPASLFWRRYAPPLLLLVMILALGAYATIESRYFFTPRNMSDLAIQVAPLAIVALGQFAVVLLGGIDLSVGPNISLATGIASLVLIDDPPFGFAIGVLMCLVICVAVGALNGFLVRFLKLPDLIATLATFSVVAGLALIVRPAPGGLINEGVTDAILCRVGYVPVAFVVALVGVVLFEALLLRSRLGLRLYAVGSSEDAAFSAGLRTGWIRFGAYLFCGCMAAIAGLIVASRIGSGDPQAGTNFTLLSITAVVVGGTSVFGGRGTAVGTFLAAVLIMLLQNVLNQVHVSAYWQYVWTGVITLVAVGIYSARGRGGLIRGSLSLFGRPAALRLKEKTR
ncbi:MAG TPA: ATP-binding cassette domain-containing protein [Bauldia sp.]|nr:ATP-binding cassette domain-containing protein [Bauldia sp.]